MGELNPLTPFATVQLKQGLEELLQRPVDLVRLRVNPALWNTEDRKDREPCTKSCTKALKNPGQAWVLRMEPSGFEPLTPCMPCRCSTS